MIRIFAVPFVSDFDDEILGHLDPDAELELDLDPIVERWRRVLLVLVDDRGNDIVERLSIHPTATIVFGVMVDPLLAGLPPLVAEVTSR